MNPPGATWIRGQRQVNDLHLDLHEANVVRQRLAFRGQMINELSRGKMINSFAWQGHKIGHPMHFWGDFVINK